MNLYFLVEGKRSEKKLYKAWIQILFPGLTAVEKLEDISNDNFYIISSEGYPPSEQFITSATQDLSTNSHLAIDHIFICFDAEEDALATKKSAIEEIILRSEPNFFNKMSCSVIIQNRCIETWLLGNRKIVSRNPISTDLRQCLQHYSVLHDDPEDLPKPNEFVGTHADYHEYYLKKMLAEKNMSYTKRNPGETQNEHYLSELIRRIHETDHLASLRVFIDACINLGATISASPGH
ncbi:MAG: hypothetical protein HQM06_08050 [Magnetococcales bacterium]|nr:hypothetical protein [Magnetococcales bacterium]